MVSVVSLMPFFLVSTLFVANANNFDLLETTTLNQHFSLKNTGTWEEFDIENRTLQFQDEKWAWIGSIIFKSKQALKLKKLNLQWVGEKLSKIHASLYLKKDSEPNVIPIEENLVCDGIWDIENQQVKFNLNEKLVAVNKYCVVLSFSKYIESKLKAGKFLLAQKNPFTFLELK